MTDTELSSLEAAARAATPGPWDTKEGPDFSEILANSKNIALVGSQHKDAAYIAAANPAVVLELIAELRQTRKERDWLAITLAEHCNEQDSSVYDAASQHCTMRNCRCLFPYKECSIINDLLWLQAANEATSCQKN